MKTGPLGAAMLAGVLLASGAAPGAAQRWEAVLLSEQGMYYIDTQSITTQGSTKVAWTVLDYRNVQEGAEGANYRSMRDWHDIEADSPIARIARRVC
jgi:hypothetical protein